VRPEAALVEDAGMRRIDVAGRPAGPELGLAGEERLAGGAVIGEVGWLRVADRLNTTGGRAIAPPV
jgi:hypothetical protein